jgi:hypothetical protein
MAVGDRFDIYWRPLIDRSKIYFFETSTVSLRLSETLQKSDSSEIFQFFKDSWSCDSGNLLDGPWESSIKNFLSTTKAWADDNLFWMESKMLWLCSLTSRLVTGRFGKPRMQARRLNQFSSLKLDGCHIIIPRTLGRQ